MAGLPGLDSGDGGKADRRPPQMVNRALYLLILVSFFFPFTTVRGCGNEEPRTYSGFELAGEELGILLCGVFALAVLLSGLSFRRRVPTAMRTGAVQALKALACALAVLTTLVATGMTFLFYRASEQIGLFLCIASWLLLCLLSVYASMRQVTLLRWECSRRPPPWGAAVAVILIATYVTTVIVSEPHGPWEVFLGAAASVLVGLPLVLLVTLGAIRYRLGSSGAGSGRWTRRE